MKLKDEKWKKRFFRQRMHIYSKFFFTITLSVDKFYNGKKIALSKEPKCHFCRVNESRVIPHAISHREFAYEPPGFLLTPHIYSLTSPQQVFYFFQVSSHGFIKFLLPLLHFWCLKTFFKWERMVRRPYHTE